MSLNLLYRIFTSAILLIILCLGLFLNKYLWLCLLILASVISYYEFYKLIQKKFNKKKNKIFLSNIISIIYLINFTYAGYALYENSHINLIFVLYWLLQLKRPWILSAVVLLIGFSHIKSSFNFKSHNLVF